MTTTKSRKKASKGRFNILLMRPKGEVMNLAVSPLMLVAAFLFALVFVVFSINIMNRYFALYLEHIDLTAAYEETAGELDRLQSLYTYQASVADDYSNLMQTLNQVDPQNGEPTEGAPADPVESPADAPEATETGEAPAAPGTPPGAGENGEAAADDPPTETSGPVEPQIPQTLEEWASLLPAVAETPEQSLDVENLSVPNGRFSFFLSNKNPDPTGRGAQGNLLLVFEVKTPDGNTTLRSYPDFDLTANDPDFSRSPAGYNIRSGKTVGARISNLPEGGEVTAMMAVAKSKAGNIVMKKLLPVGQ